MVKLKTFLLTVWCIVIFSGCIAIKQENSFAIVFKNYSNNELSLPDELLTVDYPILNPNIVFNKDFQKQMDVFGITVSDSVVEYLFDSGLVYYWNETEQYPYVFSDNRTVLIGKVVISPSFDSYLFSQIFTLKNTPQSNSLFIVNVKNSTIKSIIKISHYAVVDANSFCIYSVYKGNNTFIQRSEKISSDVIRTDRPILKKENNNGRCFRIIDDGYIKLGEEPN